MKNSSIQTCIAAWLIGIGAAGAVAAPDDKDDVGSQDGGIAGSCPGTGSCFAPHTSPGCNNELCCSAVCAIDPFCCDDHWDPLCADEAHEVCTECGGAGTGSCFTPHPNTACNDAACCDAVCAADPFCCNTDWDNQCANEANQLCCPADIAPSGGGDGEVNVIDLLAIIGAWGPCGSGVCTSDIAPPGGDGDVNVNELLAIISAWGACP
ncbi:MAG: hypothetical protein L0219_09365 [Phycisphaerales bacterium]|nr:hypothetical protein [Phycisphaerales bacterium]